MTTATLNPSRAETGAGLLAEMDRFQQLVRGLSPAHMATPTRCEGWTVADVAAHFIGSMTDVAEGRLDGLGTPEVTEREVAERRGRTAEELADELATARAVASGLLAMFDDEAWAAPAPGGYDGSLGEGVEALWFDGVVHADDIRAAIGEPTEVDRAGLGVSARHVAIYLEKQGWGPATVALEGLGELEVGGGGRRIETDPWTFVLAATGRLDPAVLGLDETVNIYR